MQITHLGHACILIETARARILVDPGSFSAGFEGLTDLDALVVTHQHADHVDTERVSALAAANPDARVLLEPQTMEAVPASLAGLASAFAAGESHTLGDLTIEALGGQHAVVHDRVPGVGNIGLLMTDGLGRTLFHPGDSYADTPDVDVLALPLNAPWCRVSETLDFLRAVSPNVVFPIHDGLLSAAGRSGYLMHVRSFGPDSTELRDLADGAPATF